MAQLNPADLAHMSPGEIDTARAEGRLNVLLGMNPADAALLDKTRTTDPLTAGDVDRLYSLRKFDLIAQANEAGRLADLLDPTKEK